MLLRKHGYWVAVAANGILALQIFESQPCDLVVTDIHMPEGDGLSLIKELKARNIGVKIIAISGGAALYMNPQESALDLGAHIALTKPISAFKLIEVVKHLLE